MSRVKEISRARALNSARSGELCVRGRQRQPESVVEQLDSWRERVQPIQGEQPSGNCVLNRLPLVHDRRCPHCAHDDDLDEALRIAEDHVDGTEQHPEPRCQQSDDDQGQQDRSTEAGENCQPKIKAMTMITMTWGSVFTIATIVLDTGTVRGGCRSS